MKERTKIVGQALSAAAVTLSVVFLALEVRQNTISSRAQTLQELGEAARAIQLHLSANPRAATAYYDLFRDGGEGPLGGRPGTPHTREDTVAAHLAMYALIRTLENVYLQAAEGIVEGDVLNRYDFVSGTFESSGFRSYWTSVRPRFDPAFVQAFEAANGIELR